jgi:hypothetical protein
MHMVVKGIVTLVGAAEAVAGKTAQLLKQVLNMGECLFVQ